MPFDRVRLGSDRGKGGRPSTIAPTLDSAAARQARLDAIAAIEAERDGTLPALAAEQEKAEREVASAREALRLAEHRFTAATNAHRGAALSFSARIADHQHALRQGAAPEIDAFQSDMRALFDSDRKRLRLAVTDGGVNLITGQREEIELTNKRALTARLQAIRDAIDAAEAMRLDAEQETVPSRLEALHAGLPAFTDMLERVQ